MTRAGTATQPKALTRECLAFIETLRARGEDSGSLRSVARLVALAELQGIVRDQGVEGLGEVLRLIAREAGAARGVCLLRGLSGDVRVAATMGRVGEAEFRLKDVAAGLSEAAGPIDPGALAGMRTYAELRGRRFKVGLVALDLEGRTPDQDEIREFVREAAAAIAGALEAALLEEEAQKLSRRLSIKVYQLRNLFELSRELNSTFDAEVVKSLTATTLMGHLMVSRAALYMRAEEDLGLSHSRGFRGDACATELPAAEIAELGEGAESAVITSDLPDGPLRRRMEKSGVGLIAPVFSGGRCEALLVAGTRPSGRPFSGEDRDFATTLGRQALSALETVRLHEVRLEKERQDRDMEIARDIQQTLFPKALPMLPGIELAARTESCFRVGGDYYDTIPLADGRVVVALGDVSGKGAPASLLMASVHAWLRARAGTAPVDALVTGLNRFLVESTLPNKFVTFFCAEIDPVARRLTYVNAGHVPPFVFVGENEVRLSVGGPVLGLLEGASYEGEALDLCRGDLVAVVTEGATEAMSENDVELGDEGILSALRRAREGSAAGALQACFDEVSTWVGEAGLSDDLTALVIKVNA